MNISKKIYHEAMAKFPSVYSLYQNTNDGRIFAFCLGGEDEKVETGVREFLKEKVSPSVLTKIVFSEKRLSMGEIQVMLMNETYQEAYSS